MNILLVSATPHEYMPLADMLHPSENQGHYRIGHHDITMLHAGIGLIPFSYRLTRILSANTYDLCINMGIAGSFNDELTLGDVVEVHTDQPGDAGAEDGPDILSLFDMGLENANSHPYKEGKLWGTFSTGLPKASGITLGRATGSESTVTALKEKFNPDVESMEGAAFYYACLSEGIPCTQIRAISNRVERRNRDSWNIPLATQQLATAIHGLLSELPQP